MSEPKGAAPMPDTPPHYQQQQPMSQQTPINHQQPVRYGSPEAQPQSHPPQQQQPYQSYQQQPASGQPQYAQPAHAVAVAAYATQPVLIASQPGMFPHFPVRMICPYCNADVQTRVSKEAGALTWLSCLGLALIGCTFGCCFIPFCIDGCKDTQHWCPNCNRMIARRDQMDC